MAAKDLERIGEDSEGLPIAGSLFVKPQRELKVDCFTIESYGASSDRADT